MEDIRILVVDYEAVVRESLTAWLRENGFSAYPVEDGPMALERVKAEDWDILMVDLIMPGMNGMEVLEEVKRLKPEIAVLIITAYPSIDTAVKAMKVGAYDYIVKPFNPEEVGLTVRKIIDYQAVVRENLRLRQKLLEAYGTRYICRNCGHELTLSDQYQ